MKTDDELIAEWLKTNTAKKYTEAEPVYTAYSGKLLPTNPITQPEICNKSKKRLYRFLGKTPLGESLDESTRNYGT